jgi:hypothetical protein
MAALIFLNQDFVQLDVQHFAERMTVSFSGGQQSFRLFGTIRLHPPFFRARYHHPRVENLRFG